LKFAYAKMKMAEGIDQMVVPEEAPQEGLGKKVLRGAADLTGALTGAAGGAMLGQVAAQHLPGALQTVAPVAGLLGGAGIGGSLGRKLVPGPPVDRAQEQAALLELAKLKAVPPSQDELLQLPENERLPPPTQAEQKTAAFRKIAIGLGGLGTAIGGGAKAVGKGAVGAFQTSRAFGGGMGDALRAAGGSIANKAPGALSTMGKAVTSYAKANPMQAAGIAGGAGLLAGHALTSKQQAN
jgi:hypothetical protein